VKVENEEEIQDTTGRNDEQEESDDEEGIQDYYEDL